MQRIFRSPWSPEEYAAQEAHRQVVPESVCPSCAEPTRLRRHGRYPRWVVSVVDVLVRLWIARFLCPLCRRTISYLPDFALSYRLLGPDTFAAFMDGEYERPDVRGRYELLQGYGRQLVRFAGELIRTVGAGLGLAPPLSIEGLWPWLKKAGDGLAPVARRLVMTFRIGLFGRYQCHQPGGP